jgi:hypothetical protein
MNLRPATAVSNYRPALRRALAELPGRCGRSTKETGMTACNACTPSNEVDREVLLVIIREDGTPCVPCHECADREARKLAEALRPEVALNALAIRLREAIGW